MKPFTIAIHGGAGTISPDSMTAEKEQLYLRGLEQALSAGHAVLKENGSAMDAVMAAVVQLEDNPLFNAGRGSVFTHEGLHEMDAAIMDGNSGNAGAVAGVKSVRNPIVLARLVMEKTEHVMLHGNGAEELAKLHHLPFESPEYFYDAYRYEQWQSIRDTETTQLDHSKNKKFGTVGAVALDVHGNVAAATSTGGMTNKRFSRIGDSPIIGAGTYAANHTCAVSCTGHGEYFILSVVAYDVSCLMEYKGLSIEEACRSVVMEKLVKTGGEGGLIAVDKTGIPQLVFNSEGMYRGYQINNEMPFTAIYR
ncbi:MAG TPA: isoaspartyl peptidase/L-asparaginase [Bacteroidia bacterium]|nr:isoaspartyl peptidase/L-asparaginase [Bacteroidia bacterium]HNR48268.1 isoaspartyl peptidase/L-asparaginase [Bacteroidia bacterium]HNT82485.1 isoaspartyl peptidase/L-asparaginase [Bacteroidia bacterium]